MQGPEDATDDARLLVARASCLLWNEMAWCWRVTLAVLAAAAAAASPAIACSRWEARAPMGVPRQEIALAVVGATLYAVGGYVGSTPSAAVEVYDTRTDAWRSVAPLPQALHHVMAAAVDGVVHATGGLGAPTATGASDATWRFDPAVGGWEPRAPLPRPRGAGAVAVIRGRMYVVGGLRGSSVGDLAAYDPVTDAWAELPPMPTARDHLAAGAVGDRLVVVGGRDAGVLYDVVEIFDPTTGRWTTGHARMPTARGGLGAAVLDGLLHVVGGEGNVASPLGTFPQHEVYDAAHDVWTSAPAMDVPRHGLGVAAVGGLLYAMGGSTRQGVGPSGDGERYVPGDALAIRRLSRRRSGRLALRGRLVAPDAVDFAAAIRVDADGRPLVSLPAGSLVASRRGARWRLRHPPAAGVLRLDLRRRPNGDVAVRLVATGAARLARPTTVAVAFGDRAFCGSAP